MSARAKASAAAMAEVAFLIEFADFLVTKTGRAIRKELPTPSFEVSQSVPPIRRISLRQMGRPSPVPPNRRVMLVSAYWNGSKS